MLADEDLANMIKGGGAFEIVRLRMFCEHLLVEA
jgi:hypothetical protein